MSELRFSRLCLLAAFGLTLLWAGIYIAFARSELCDEPGHVAAAEHYAAGLPGWPSLPHPPAYHLFVNALSLGHPDIVTARATSTVFALLGLVSFAGAWRRLHQTDAGPPTLVLALLPILQPFTAMAYTDVTSLAWLLCAWWAQVSGRFFRAAALMGVACLVRQTNVIWAAFFVAWEALRALDAASDSTQRWRVAASAAWTRGRWHLLVIALGALVVLALGRFTPGTDHGNEPKPNIAAFHGAAWLALVFGFPVWLFRGPRPVSSSRAPTTWGAKRGFICAGASVLVVGLLAVTFNNPHEWNQLLWWGTRIGKPYLLLRNWPLLQVDAHFWLRIVSGVSVVAVVGMTVVVFQRQPHRHALWLVLLFGAVLLATNSLVDPRYYITPAAFLLCLLKLEPRTYLWLAAWFALLCALHDPFIVMGKSLW
jgi:hypothetical protein